MGEVPLRERVQATSEWLRQRGVASPAAAVILGSGYGELVSRLEDGIVLEARKIPHFPRPAVSGHAGQLACGRFGRTAVLMQSGRKHLYEGEGVEPVIYPILCYRALGVRSLVLTNAAGSGHADWPIGDIMMARDHLDTTFHAHTHGIPRLVEEAGVQSAGTPHDAFYSNRLAALARDAAREAGVALHEGTYTFSLGPFYESAAEIRALCRLGGDAFGMSTAPEAIAATLSGMEVVAFSGLTNLATGIAEIPHDHATVTANARALVPRMSALLAALLPRLNHEPHRDHRGET